MENSSIITGNRKARLVFIIGALTAFGPLSIDIYLPGLPSLFRAFQFPGWQAQLTQLTLAACLLGLFLYTTASFLGALSPSVPLLVFLRYKRDKSSLR